MSKTIDHKIVEMRFDNKQFEANAKQTMGTLGKLKEALKLPESSKALEGIDEAVKGIKLDGIAAGVEALERRFSTLGIVGMRVIENITDGLMNKLHSAVNFVTDSIVSGGIKRAMNIENAHFQLQALLKDETKVQAVMADAMESVDGTAYAYDEAAKAAAQFSASGIQSGEEMLGALKGITGVAAMTNSSFEDISMIFTTVAGNGRLMGDQLLQLSSRGLNAASTLADYFREVRGQAGMTEGTIREMVSKGQISFKDFSDAMTWAFGDSAKRANETFTGALSNMKSALARIGAGFISPLIEQNGELVNLFNALRIKINDVKTALVFDEQSSAISGLSKEMTLMDETFGRFIGDGTIGFENLTKGLTGLTEESVKFEKTNEKLAESFNQVKENGKLTNDVLGQFKDQGVNVTIALRDYINGVNKGTIEASDSMKTLIKEISGGTWSINSDIEKMVSDGKINFDIFSAAMAKASGETVKSSDNMSAALKGLFSEVKDQGGATTKTLEDFSKQGVNATKALMDYMNGVNKGTIRASYATRQAIEELSGGVHVTTLDIKRFAEEGKISFDIFQSAMEESFGDSTLLSKQFSDSFLDVIKKVVTAINEADMTKPMEIFYYWVESVKNVSKGLWSVLKPVGKAFADIFLNFNADDVITFSEAVERLTSKMKLSEKGSENLHDSFEGIFSIVKLLADVFFELFGAIVPINKPVLEMGGGFLGLAGAMGRGLTKFTEMIRSCRLLRKSFDFLASGFSFTMDGLSGFIRIGRNAVSSLSELDGTSKLIDSLVNAFERLYLKAVPYIESFDEVSIDMFGSLINFEDVNIDDVLNNISQAFSDLAWEIDHFSLETVNDAFDVLHEKIESIGDLAMSNEGFATFVRNFKKFAEDLKEAFTMDNLLDRIEKVMDVFGRFFNWIKDIAGPAFEDFSIGNTIAGAGGIGIIYAMIKVAKSFEKMTHVFSSIPDLLGGIKGTLVAYQKELKAEALLKISAAIAVLAGALVLLSFTDTDRLLEASIALSLIAGVLMLGVSKLLESVNKGRELNDAIRVFARGLSSTMKKLGRAMEIKAIGGMVKDFATSIAIIAASIIGLGVMYRKDPSAFNMALKTVEEIGKVLVAIIVLMSIASKLGNAKKMDSICQSVLMISASLGLIVLSISKLMKINLPENYKSKLDILGGIIAGLGVLSILLGIAARAAGGNDLPNMAKTIKSLAVLLVATVLSLKVLFDINLPEDYKAKLDILGGIFAWFGVMLLAMAAAAKIADSKGFKAAGTILAMAGFLAVVVGSLFVLTLIPTDKLLKGAVGLGAVLISLGVALAGAGKVSDENSYKTVLAMAITVGVITASLAILGMTSWDNLLKGVVGLSSVLLALSVNFKSLSKVGSKKALPAALSMIAATLAIAYSLQSLSEQPWEKLLSAAAAMSATLLAFSKSFEMILGKRWSDNNVKKIGTFLLLTLSVVPIGAALAVLANQPWEGMLASAVALSSVLMALSAAFLIVSKVKISLDDLVAFGAAVVAACAVAVPLGILANQSPEGLVSAALSLSLVIGTLSGVLAILSAVHANVGTASQAALALSAFIGILGGVMTGLGALFSNISSLEGFLDKGIEILIKIGDGLGRFIGSIVEGLLTEVSNALPVVGNNLSLFWTSSSTFFHGIGTLDDETFGKVGKLAACLIALTVAELVSAIGSFMGVGFSNLGVELSMFMISALPFFLGLNNVKPESLEAAKNIGSMILALTASDVIRGIAGVLGLSGSLSEFGEELVAFGPAISEFADQVKNVKPEAVQGAASAAEIMATVAEKLPPQSGLAQKLFGERSLAVFGQELTLFGLNIVPFTEIVKNVNPASVVGTALVTTIMTNLANNLPNTETLWSKIFGGGQVSLSEFGEELVKFGTSMTNFSNSVSGINAAQVSAAISSFKEVVDLANYVQGTSAFDLVNFSNQLGLIGTDSINNFIEAFVTNVPKMTETVNTFIGAAITAIQIKNIEFLLAGNESSNQYLNGMKALYPIAVITGTELANKVLSALQLKIAEFLIKGTASANQYLQGFKNKYGEAYSVGSTLANNVLSGCQGLYNNFYSAGSNAGQGFIDGIRSKLSEASEAGRAIGKAAYEAAKAALDEHSPSKKMGEVGMNAGLGFILKLMQSISDAEKAGRELGEAALNGANSIPYNFMEDLDFDPTIRPVVDLSNVKKSVSEITDMFNNTIKMTTDMTDGISRNIGIRRDEQSVPMLKEIKKKK